MTIFDKLLCIKIWLLKKISFIHPLYHYNQQALDHFWCETIELLEGVIITALQSFCHEFDETPGVPDRLRLLNLPQYIDNVYAANPLEPLLVKAAYLQRVHKNIPKVKFEACSYNSDDDSLSEVSFTCHGTLREKIVIPSPDEFSDD